MSAASKKPPATGNALRPSSASSNNSTPTNRSPSRMAPQASERPNGVNRTRSVRGGAGTPISARAAARKPAESDAATDEVRAEMQAKLDELHERLQRVEQAYEASEKHSAVLQVQLDEARKEQAMLEETVHEQTERMEELENEKREGLRARRELELINEAERVATMKEREEVQAREDDYRTTIQRLKETLAQREMRAGLDESSRPNMSRSSSFRSSTASPDPAANGHNGSTNGSQFAPPSSLQRSDSRSNSKLVNAKDKIIEGLRLELAEAQIKVVESENIGGGRFQQLQRDMYDIKMQNARLMEENESFQLLLSEKTLNGDFTAPLDLLRPPSHAGSRPSSRGRQEMTMGTSLADELDSQASDTLDTTLPFDDPTRKLQTEVNSLKDQNKALTLYINNIISRLLQHDGLESILDKTPDIMAGPGAASTKYGGGDTEKALPPPPPTQKDEPEEAPEQPQGFLQRARSVMGSAARPRPRPTSRAVASGEQVQLAAQLSSSSAQTAEPRGNENPETAPRIPLSRSTSRGGHRRANSEWPTASLVTNMYRGPSPTPMLTGPVSPGLSSPMGAKSSSFFSPLTSRVPSGNTVPTISSASNAQSTVENDKENERAQHRDSKHSISAVGADHSARNSVASNPDTTSAPANFGHLDASSSDPSNPSSPPRSTTSSSGDREGLGGGRGGAIMMGSKPRPLRLVQEANASDDAAKKAANRGSWFGWMNKGAAPAGPGVGTSGGVSSGRSVSGDGGSQ